MSQADPHRPADDEAILAARALLASAATAVLAVLGDTGWPMTSRIALQTDAAGVPLAMLSGLALHTRALQRDPRAALLIDAPAEADARDTALNRARLSLQVRAVPAPESDHDRLSAAWRACDPKAAVYLQLPDFRFWRLTIRGGLLNQGFGRATLFGPDDLAGAPDPKT